MHRVYVEFEVLRLKAGEEVVIEGEEAHHALRVKRLEAGDRLAVLDGRGGIAEGALAAGTLRKKDAALRVVIERVRKAERVTPRVEVFTATPKGGRADEMIDQLSQAGASSWSALETVHGVVDPRETKLARLERIAREASKQCGRAWVMEIGEKMGFAEALRPSPSERVEVVVADASGEAYAASGAPVIRLLVGPEGGFTAEEMAAARAAGARVVRFGPHVMRIETAAVVGVGVVMGRSQI